MLNYMFNYVSYLTDKTIYRTIIYVIYFIITTLLLYYAESSVVNLVSTCWEKEANIIFLLYNIYINTKMIKTLVENKLVFGKCSCIISFFVLVIFNIYCTVIVFKCKHGF